MVIKTTSILVINVILSIVIVTLISSQSYKIAYENIKIEFRPREKKTT